MTVYTMGIWNVKPGREDDFLGAWDALAQWTIESGFETHGTLTRDRENPSRFVSFGPWPSAEHAQRWRDDPGFREHFARLEETVESFEPGTFDVVARIS
jgi:heme-degrading monooxygenase HmoA